MCIRIIIVLIAVFPMLAVGGWEFVNKVDDFTDEKVMFAVYSDEEHRVQLSHVGTSVWMFITRKKIGTFEPNGIIELRVDRDQSIAIEPAKLKRLGAVLGKPTFQWEPSAVGFLIWHGNEEAGCGFIGKLLKGKELKIRYQVNTLERDMFRVSLADAKKSIIGGLGLTICGRE